MKNRCGAMFGRPRAKGLALVIVLSALALTAILGYAMLSSAGLQARSLQTSSAGLSANALAESGIEVACYYIQYPAKAIPKPAAGAFWAGGNVTFGSSVTGSADVTVSSPSAKTYIITSLGKAPSGNVTLTRKATAKVYIEPGFQVPFAGNFNGATVSPLGVTYNGDLQVNGLLTNVGKITGKAYAPVAPVNTGTISGGWTLLDSSNKTRIPIYTEVRSYATYTYNGQTYNATVVGNIAANTTLSPSPTNPAGIFRAAGNITIASNVTINGTLVVDGALDVTGTNAAITSANGYPGLVTRTDLTLRGPAVGRDLTVNGLAYIGGDIKQSGLITTGKIDVNGAIMFGKNGGKVDATFLSKLNVTFDSNRLGGLDLDTQTPAASVKFLSYSE